MTGDDGARLSRELMSHGLLVKRSAIPLIESVDNLDQLIQAALEKSIRLLDDSSVRSLIQSGSNFIETPEDGETQTKEIQEPPSKKFAGNSGRILAPLERKEIQIAPRPHGLEHYSIGDFPMDATEIDPEIEIHFDITGNSVTEGRLTDMQSCFTDRLAKIRKMIMDSGSLPTRPSRISDAWRERKSRNSPEKEVSIVGLVEFKRFGRNGDIQFALEDETGSVECILYPKPEWTKTHPVTCLLYTSPSPRDRFLSRMPSSA